MRIAIASNDGIVINTHFGRATSFYIYERQGDEIYFIEKRVGKPFCHFGEHEENQLMDAVELLNDCTKLYVLQIGQGAEEALLARGIRTVAARGIITEVLERFEHMEKGVS